ncbi:hypothetical protein SRB17_40390 [Streptomyces sp. RB17]|uniref:hypothetical protein n=1 Tax=Streptomyces sp. RB17 TaxID=2585197 RepID=UPI0013063FBF|nr:hypothetical protein [Streptomyces sp. RB17]MQY36042.1 hypothetical protein [Streptomyces sp. RB17]
MRAAVDDPDTGVVGVALRLDEVVEDEIAVAVAVEVVGNPAALARRDGESGGGGG